MAASKSKQKSLSLKERFTIIKEVDKRSGRHGAKTEVAKQFGIANSTLSTILKDRQKIISAFEESSFQPERKRMRLALYDEVEEGLLIWFKSVREKNVPVSGPILQTKAEEIARELGISDFSCSSGWIHRFKTRHDIVQKKVCGESASVNEETVSAWLSTTLPSVLEGYKPSDVFNTDETGLFFRLLPDKTLAFKNKSCHGGKQSKERITVMVGANSDGSEKLPLLVIGKSKNPRCFKNVKSLPVDYTNSKKAWMNGDIYTTWLMKLDRRFQRQKRNILMIVDNCPAHPDVSGLKNIKVVFLPPNTTSQLQPMDQGVIRSLKAHYRSKLLNKMIAAIDSNQSFNVTLLDSLYYIQAAWGAVNQSTLVNCFKKSGFTGTSETEDDVEEEVESEVEHQLHYLQQCGIQGLDSLTVDDYISVDNVMETTEEVTTSAIVAQIQARRGGQESVEEDSDEEDDNSDESLPVPSLSEVASCLDKLRTFFQSKEGGDAFFDSIGKMDTFIDSQRGSWMRQSLLTDFINS